MYGRALFFGFSSISHPTFPITCQSWPSPSPSKLPPPRLPLPCRKMGTLERHRPLHSLFLPMPEDLALFQPNLLQQIIFAIIPMTPTCRRSRILLYTMMASDHRRPQRRDVRGESLRNGKGFLSPRGRKETVRLQERSSRQRPTLPRLV